MKLIYLCILMHLSALVNAQQTDSLFRIAKEAAFNHETEKAKSLIHQLVMENPCNHDFIKFYANVYAWNKEYSSAIQMLKSIPTFETDFETQQLYCTYLIWSQDFEKAHQQVSTLIAMDSSNVEYRLLELDILFALKKYGECYKKSEALLPNSKAELLHRNCSEFVLDKSISMNCQMMVQGTSVSWMNQLAYSQSVKKYMFIPSFYIAQRLSKHGSQYQFEIYRKWRKYGYSYFSSTFSKSDLFAKYSLAFVHFIPTLKRVETDWGIRLFSSQLGYRSIVPSMGISYSFDQLNINYRVYKIISPLSNGMSHSFSISKYLKQPAHFLRLDLGIGNQVDRLSNPLSLVSINRKGHSLGLTYSRPIGTHIKLRLSVNNQQQRINEAAISKAWLGSISFTYKFATK